MSADIFNNLPLLQDARPETGTTGLKRDLFLTPEHVAEAARRLLAADFHLEDISAMDTAEALLITYHFNRFDRNERTALRVLTPHDRPGLPSIAAIYAGAEWHEREIGDFFGVVFQGNPNPAPLLLAESGVSSPLLKSETKRVSIREVLRPGRIVHQHPNFTLFRPETRPDAETAQPKEAQT